MSGMTSEYNGEAGAYSDPSQFQKRLLGVVDVRTIGERPPFRAPEDLERVTIASVLRAQEVLVSALAAWERRTA